MKSVRFIDLFCGVGGFRLAAQKAVENGGAKHECVFSSDIDKAARQTYKANFGHEPFGDITKVDAVDIPDHDLLLAGFPCQPFSIIGEKRGFEDTRGTLFFDIVRILKTKRPAVFVLENVKQLVGHQKGETFKTILRTLDELGYTHYYKVLNALDFGLPQKRERVFIVGFDKKTEFEFPLFDGKKLELKDVLENAVHEKFVASKHITDKRKARHTSKYELAIWHENKSGNISSYPFSCALRANASHNYLLVNGERRLTPREMFRLQGFPDSFKMALSNSQASKQAGNSLPVPVAEAVIAKAIEAAFRE
jgi:DNA (cytosine-5)-methyltransferase 1